LSTASPFSASTRAAMPAGSFPASNPRNRSPPSPLSLPPLLRAIRTFLRSRDSGRCGAQSRWPAVGCTICS
jgi:hypothetical protein